MLAMSDDDSRKSSSPQRSKSTVSGSTSESKQTAQNKIANSTNSVKPNMVYIVSSVKIINKLFLKQLFIIKLLNFRM